MRSQRFLGWCSALAVSALVAVGTGHAQSLNPQGGEIVPGRLIVQFKEGVEPAQRGEVLSQVGASVRTSIPQIGVVVVDLPSGADEHARAAAFGARPEVVFAELDRVFPPSEVPNDPFYATNQPQLAQIGAPDAWAQSTGSESVIIAILDSGVDGTHVDLVGNLVPGWNCFDDNADVTDVYGHGTYVAGTAGATTDNNEGVASIGWSSRIMPVRVTRPDGYASTSAIVAGLVWAADHGARVANLSFDLTCCMGSIEAGAQYFQDHGGIVVTAAGNNGGNYVPLPDNPLLFTVSAVELDDTRAWWSSYGEYVDLSAPKSAASTRNGGGYTSASGTSISSPYVAGVAALILSVNPGLTGQQVQDVLEQSSVDLGPAGRDPEYGWGRLDAAAALTLAQQTSGDGGGTPDPGDPGSGEDLPPWIQILTPGQGDAVRGMVRVDVDVADADGIAVVELYVDGALVDSVTSGDFTTRWRANQSGPGPHVLQCVAIDAMDNVGLSQTITVTR